MIVLGGASARAGECTELPGARVGECGEPQRHGAPSSTTSTTTAPTPAASNQAGPDHEAAARLATLVNEARQREGLPRLSIHDEIAAMAWDHSATMAPEGRIWHNDAYFTVENRQRLGAKALGENVALNRNADDAHARLMASPGHRSNILDRRFTHAGIGAVRDADGALYITQDFAHMSSRAPSPPPAPPPSDPAHSGAASASAPDASVPPPARPSDGTPSEVLGATDAPRSAPVARPRSPQAQMRREAPPDVPAQQSTTVAGAVMAIAAVGLCDRAGRRIAPSLFST